MIIFSVFINSKSINIELLAIESMNGFDEQGSFQHENGYRFRTQELKGDIGNNEQHENTEKME